MSPGAGDRLPVLPLQAGGVSGLRRSGLLRADRTRALRLDRHGQAALRPGTRAHRSRGGLSGCIGVLRRVFNGCGHSLPVLP